MVLIDYTGSARVVKRIFDWIVLCYMGVAVRSIGNWRFWPLSTRHA